MSKEELIEGLQRLHDYLDEVNNELGIKDNLCRFCHSREYDSIKGIVHENDCPILALRQVISEHSPLPDSEGLLSDEVKNHIAAEIKDVLIMAQQPQAREGSVSFENFWTDSLMAMLEEYIPQLARCQADKAEAVRKAKQEERERTFAEIEQKFASYHEDTPDEDAYYTLLEYEWQALKEGK